MTETVLGEQEEVMKPSSYGEICPPVGPRYTPEAQEGAETAGTGELDQGGGERDSDKLPDIVVPDATLKRAEYSFLIVFLGL
ncbi:hypothetical protein NDU88_003456 [Pleurodeles waltl]|uniref:Uncharacterized protein n=1 Tax=Pleurodeles waltl TaxID=8319 RepID=A0AAV7MVN6_PLEWA|nr:hypothetical protein NDU88_003456 [Pleurodeles waltl]